MLTTHNVIAMSFMLTLGTMITVLDIPTMLIMIIMPIMVTTHSNLAPHRRQSIDTGAGAAGAASTVS